MAVNIHGSANKLKPQYILLGNVGLFSWWVLAVGSWPLMVITDPSQVLWEGCCRANTDDSSPSSETLTAVSAGCGIYVVSSYDLQNIYKIFHFGVSRAAAIQQRARQRAQAQADVHMCPERDSLQKDRDLQPLTYPNTLMFWADVTGHSTLLAAHFSASSPHCPVLRAACNPSWSGEAQLRPRGRFWASSS